MATATRVKRVPPRSQVSAADTWDLGSLFADDQAWEAAFQKWTRRIPQYAQYRGTLAQGPAELAACLKFDSQMDRASERLRAYAYLKTSEDTTNSTYQRMVGRYRHAASQAAQASSFLRPEILAIPSARMKQFLADKRLARYRLLLQRLRRYKKHTLSSREENLLAMQSEMAGASNHIFEQLHNADLKFGTVKNEKGELVELTNSTFGSLLNSPSRPVRRQAFHQYYQQYHAHRYTLAATLHASMQRDVYYARARRFDSALEAALFPDKVPVAVYDNLIASVRRGLPALYRYYDVRRRAMKLREIHHYDTYVPILSELETRHTWNQAVKTIVRALEPLGSEYCGVLEKGLLGRWCDRYENQGKRSGAFSYGTFDGDPYILMNYKPEVLNHVFTLAHEAGHSMHSHLSARHQPYEYYDYTIFVAEVASTFNEELLSHYLLQRARSDQERAYLINRAIDDIRGTIFRQTMFAEFERLAHALVEEGEPLTVDRFLSLYRELLETYFGPDFTLDEELPLECFRIPHFYRAFYVYKYATGMSAAIALSQRVLNGGAAEREAYLGFLKGGCSKDPLDLLRGAGVDMEQPDAVNAAIAHFEKLVDELDRLL